MTRAAIAFPISFILGCQVNDLDLEGKRCPCVEGWICDTGTDLCVRDPTFADARIDSRPGEPDAPMADAPPPPDARVDAMPGETCLGSAPGAVLISDNFEDLIGWTNQSGTWAINAEAAEQTNESADVAVMFPAGTLGFTDYRVKVLMRQLVGSATDAMEIPFRVQGGNDEQYRCGWEPSTGRIRINRHRSNGMVDAVVATRTITLPGGFDPLAPVTMEVLTSGSTHTCCIIELPEATVTGTDTRFGSGAPGVGTRTMSASFDDFRVYMP